MTVVVVFAWLVFALVLALALIGSRRLYESVQAPLQRHPEATEPSEAGYAYRNVLRWFAVACFGVVAVVITVVAR